ncbi:hypothetical protein Tco_0434052, partial [Tanacetum coccineum]
NTPRTLIPLLRPYLGVLQRAPSARTANNPTRNASTTTDAPMSVAAINQLIEARVAEAFANEEQLRNNGVNGDGIQNSRSGTERPTCTPLECTFVKPKNLNKSKMTKMPLMKEKCIKA